MDKRCAKLWTETIDISLVIDTIQWVTLSFA